MSKTMRVAAVVAMALLAGCSQAEIDAWEAGQKEMLDQRERFQWDGVHGRCHAYENLCVVWFDDGSRCVVASGGNVAANSNVNCDWRFPQ